MSEYYEQPADGARAGLCSVCKCVKPITHFEERISRAASIERGYAGSVRLVRERFICSACRPKKKTLGKRTRKELATMAATGDIRRFKAEGVVARQQAELKDKQHKAGRKTAFNMHHKNKWKEISAALAKEQQAVRMQVYNLKRKGNSSDTKPELYAFATRYFAALSQQRQLFAIDRQRMQAPPATSWQLALSEELYRELDSLYRQVTEKDSMYPTRVPTFYDERKGNNPEGSRPDAR